MRGGRFNEGSLLLLPVNTQQSLYIDCCDVSFTKHLLSNDWHYSCSQAGQLFPLTATTAHLRVSLLYCLNIRPALIGHSVHLTITSITFTYTLVLLNVMLPSAPGGQINASMKLPLDPAACISTQLNVVRCRSVVMLMVKLHVRTL